MKKLDKTKFYNWELHNQWYLPKHFQLIAEIYGDNISFNKIMEFYITTVDEILSLYNVSTLSQVGPFGYGYLITRNEWEKKIKKYLKELKTIKK